MTAGMTELTALQLANPNPSSWKMWAEVGLGDPDSEETITPPSEQDSLYRPLLCKKPDIIGYLNEESYALGHVLLSTEVDEAGDLVPTQYLYLVFHFPSKMMADTRLPGAYIRELAVYINGNCELHTGTLLTIINNNRIWWDAKAQFQKELILVIPPVEPVS